MQCAEPKPLLHVGDIDLSALSRAQTVLVAKRLDCRRVCVLGEGAVRAVGHSFAAVIG